MTLAAQPFWHTPAVRHLAWLCHAPPLLADSNLFRPAEHLPDDWLLRLQALDQAPAPLLDCLEQAGSRRLGHYFERLYAYLLEQVLGWPILLHNLPVRDGQGLTLGELDFVVRNPVTGEAEHHELAVKYYLGLAEPQRTRWYGPNAHDRLDLKRDRLLNHQSQMTLRPATRRLLAEAGLQAPLPARILMPGNLFYPISGDEGLRSPDWVNPGHERGHWLAEGELASQDCSDWVPLHKPDWLGAYQCRQPPDADARDQHLARIRQYRRPGLFARMAMRADRQGYQEMERYFVVPDTWPDPGAREQA